MKRNYEEENTSTASGHGPGPSDNMAQWRSRDDLARIAYSPLRKSYSSYLERQLTAPPPLPLPSLAFGALGEAFIGATQIYFDALLWHRVVPAGWTAFERTLAFNFAYLILALADHPRETPRRDFILLFLRSLSLRNWRGRPRKAREKLRAYIHGEMMKRLWDNEVGPAWNMKVSLENQGQDPEARLRRTGVSEDVIRVVLLARSVEASLARVYAGRNNNIANVAFGTARNALRDYLKMKGIKLAPSVY